MKPLFSSLGSNYTLRDCGYSFTGLLLARFAPAIVTQQFAQIKTYFDATFEGETFFFYKGRDAIECALRAAGVTAKDAVITQAFTCYAIEEAIHRLGAEVVYADIQENSSNLSLATLQAAHKRAKKPVKAVIVQYSLGCSLDTEAIAHWCKKEKIILIEDLAQGFGAQTLAGKEVGTIGDITIFSFGRDKIIDSVTGGACCLRTPSDTVVKKIAQWYAKRTKPQAATAIRVQHFYPLITWSIRQTFGWGVGPLTVGKLLAFCAKKLGLLPTPLKSETDGATLFPLSFTLLLAHKIDELPDSLAHRKEISAVYQEAFGDSAATFDTKVLERGSYQRYPILVAHPQKIAAYVSRKGIYVADRWYRAAVDCSTLSCASVYTSGLAPNAERLAARVLTLPTHRYITHKDAERIVAEVQAAHL